MAKKKPQWGKPKLIILTRGKPEERALDACKNNGYIAIGPDNYGCVHPTLHIACWQLGS